MDIFVQCEIIFLLNPVKEVRVVHEDITKTSKNFKGLADIVYEASESVSVENSVILGLAGGDFVCRNVYKSDTSTSTNIPVEFVSEGTLILIVESDRDDFCINITDIVVS